MGVQDTDRSIYLLCHRNCHLFEHTRCSFDLPRGASMNMILIRILLCLWLLWVVDGRKRSKKVDKIDPVVEEAAKKVNPASRRSKKAHSPMELGMKRDSEECKETPLSEQKEIPGGTYWFGTQMGDTKGKIVPHVMSDGAAPRRKATVGKFLIDSDVVTNKQYRSFVSDTNYITEAEVFGWSFVFEGLASDEVKAEVDGETGYGRVKNALHWMAVKGANWKHPYGPDTFIDEHNFDHPAVHISYKDAEEYCAWATGTSVTEGTSAEYRLPTEREWEYAARGGLVNKTYPWGDDAPKREQNPNMNVWHSEKDQFPDKNDVSFDKYYGLAPTRSYTANGYGVYNMVGNVWEWVLGGKPDQRILRGGSFIDSVDGSFNHAVMVSTRQVNPGDSGACNIGFRCASGSSVNVIRDEKATKADAIAEAKMMQEIRMKKERSKNKESLEEHNRKVRERQKQRQQDMEKKKKDAKKAEQAAKNLENKEKSELRKQKKKTAKAKKDSKKRKGSNAGSAESKANSGAKKKTKLQEHIEEQRKAASMEEDTVLIEL